MAMPPKPSRHPQPCTNPPNPNSNANQDITDLLETPKYDGRLMYVKGSPMVDQHLENVRAATAEGFFIFVDK